MPPSALFHILKKTGCRRLVVTTELNINRATFAKLPRKGKRGSKDIWFATTYPGEGKLSVAVSAILRKKDSKGNWRLFIYWFLTDSDPPSEFLPFPAFERALATPFGEREVDARAEFSFDKGQVVSVFRPIEIGEQSQILDEIIGFTGVRHDPDGKILYTMEIALSDKSIELKLSFRQTVKLGDNTPIGLLETASKLSALAIRPKENT